MGSSELDTEIAMLQKVRHPNIVLFFGAGTSPDGAPFLVAELVELGTLSSYLRHEKETSWNLKRSFALDTAKGMAHVHGMGRMHRDLKSGNLLVSASLRVKVADFGTATIASMATKASVLAAEADEKSAVNSKKDAIHTKGVGTPLWMAPEIIAGKKYGPSADVYSFGIVMWEIAAQAVPWEDVPDTNFFAAALLRLITEGQRPVVSDDWPSTYRDLMARCWATEATERPGFDEACAVLTALKWR